MSKLKKLSNSTDSFIQVNLPVTSEELEERSMDYEQITPVKMALKYNDEIYKEIQFLWRDNRFGVQYNCCANPFCKNYGFPQEKFNLKNKPSRYRVYGPEDRKRLLCNPDKQDPNGIPTLGCATETYSNWSIVEEINRLIRVNSVVPFEKDYIFHNENCLKDTNPFEHPKEFYKRGVSSSNSQKFQCKECKKITNVLPTKRECTTYHQQRNDILHQFARMLINKVPVSRTCELLGIGRGTYYSKLEWLYRCCLEFLEDKETKALTEKNFNDIWLNTDKLKYVLNNVRKKGQEKRERPMEDKQLPTEVIITADLFSRYVFRADIAYDWDITFEQIQHDTELYKEDHLNIFLRKNARFGRYSAYPKRPTQADEQTLFHYQEELNEFVKRQQYVNGLHVGLSYTTMAHLWLIKQLVNTKKWRFITDEDSSLIASYKRVFNQEIKNKDAHYFLCKTDKTLSRNEAYEEFIVAKKELIKWAKSRELEFDNLTELANWYLSDVLKTHRFHKTIKAPSGESYNVYANNPIKHPLATIDRGKRIIDVLTDVSHLSNYQLASA